MKNKSIILKFIASVAAVVAVIGTVSLTRDLIKKHRIETRKPILKVVSESQSGMMVLRKKHYYTVYDNGDYEEVNQFEISDIDTYDLGMYNEGSFLSESEKKNLENYPKCTKAIVEYAEQLDHSLLNNLYVTDGRYFFDIYDNRGMRKKYTSTVFEYFPDDNSVKRIVQFKDYYTQYVELY